MSSLRLMLVCALVAACAESDDAQPEAPVAVCPVGSIGCPCARDRLCGTDGAGDPMICLGADPGRCAPASCQIGATGCVCDGSCAASTDVCDDGVCRPAGCAAGSLFCECLAGACSEGLACEVALGGGTCVDHAGYLGGPCVEGRCRDAAVCDDGLCVGCELGSAGCVPDGTRCDAGLVLDAGRCVAPPAPEPVAVGCATPCRADLVDGPVVRRCGPDGLMAGCVGALVCVDGSCVAEGDAAKTCSGDAECPAHQRCAGSRCLSECESDDACPAGRVCHLRVCRVPCERTAGARDTCALGTYCDTRTGVAGVCMPLAPAPEALRSRVMATFSLDRDTLSLSSARPRGDIVISTDADVPVALRVERRSHRTWSVEGELTGSAPDDGEAPLSFVTLRVDGVPSDGTLIVPERCLERDLCPRLTVEAGPGPEAHVWEGVLAITHPDLGERRVTLVHRSDLSGRWSGTLHTFSSFPDVGIASWTAGNRLDTSLVLNGLITRWGAFRRGAFTGGVAELFAMFAATENGAWAFEEVARACPATATGGACYPFVDTTRPDASLGVRTFVSNLANTPLPTGHTELPFALVLAEVPGRAGELEGRVDSATTLHWPGDPAASLTLAPDGRCDPAITDACVQEVRALEVDGTLAGRYFADGPTCAEGFTAAVIPWLSPGLVHQAARVECRPASGALTNPVPDGREKARSLRLLDGVLINGETFVLLYEERTESLLALDGPATSAYGYLILRRERSTSAELDWTPAPPQASTDLDTPVRLSCDASMAERLIGRPVTSVEDAESLVLANLDGQATSDAIPALDVHYYCEDTGLFSAGPNDTRPGPEALEVACPPESNVVYFAVTDGSMSRASIAAMPCQASYDRASGTRGTCGPVLAALLERPGSVTLPAWRCEQGTTCSSNRFDLREGKLFFAPDARAVLPLEAQIDDAFRYRTRFVSREGRPVGFAPRPCSSVGSDATPYCYDAAQLAEIWSRVDCLYSVAPLLRGRDSVAALRLFTFMSSALGAPADQASGPYLREGFERLSAELLVMLGDEQFTAALRSRFDRAGLVGATFRGSALEEGGVDLTGVAGHELDALYRAAQLYEAVTERFYALAPTLIDAVAAGDIGAPPRTVTSATVTSYLDRIVRASAQRARTWSAIAERYLALARPDLARGVIRRAYASIYLESAQLADLMLAIQRRTSPAARDQVIASLELASLRYRVALQEMRAVHESVSDTPTYFGYAADYVPFPVRDNNDTRASNAFEDVLRQTLETIDAARRMEELALASSREFDTDQASFAEELARIAVNYADKVSPICGLFVGDDGVSYVATPQNAHRSARTAALGDPCGAVGNGQIEEQLRQIELLLGERQLLLSRRDNTIAEIRDEERRVRDRCGLINGLADFRYRIGSEIADLQSQIRRSEALLGVLDRVSTSFATTLGFVRCSNQIECAVGAAVAAGWVAASATHQVFAEDIQSDIDDRRDEIDQLELESARWETVSQCDALQIDSAPMVAQKARDLGLIDIELSQLLLRMTIADGELRRLRLEASRLIASQLEAEQLAIDAEAARNDPNVRIFRNDAVLNADAAFKLALRQTWRTTLVYEYYTSTTYARRDQIFLVRMVGRGDYNLDRYLAELRDSFFAFEETFRAPAPRVERISVRDDVFAIPLTDPDGRALDQSTRNRLFRERLLDPGLLDARGRLRIPFATTRDELAPCTRNHKLDFIEVALFGGDLGDDEADVLIWQDGTGTIETLREGTAYHRLPPAVVVAQPYFNRATVFDPSVYRRYEMRERPYLNSSWAIVLDQVQSRDNQDIELGQLDDIALYLYYSDFTDAESCK